MKFQPKIYLMYLTDSSGQTARAPILTQVPQVQVMAWGLQSRKKLRISIMGKSRRKVVLAQAQLLQSLCHYSTAKHLLKRKKGACQTSRRLKNFATKCALTASANQLPSAALR
jgi:hypothetical protein